MSISQATVKHLYSSVIDDVITNCREAFLDDGVDDSVLQELRQLWETKLMASKAVVVNSDPVDPQPPPLPKNNKSGGAKKSQNAQAAVQPVPAAVESAGEPSVPPLAGTVTNNGAAPMQTTNVTNTQTVNHIHQPMGSTNHTNQVNRPMTQVIQNQATVTQTMQTLVPSQQLQSAMLSQQAQPQPQPQAQPQPQPALSQLAMVPITITLPSGDTPKSITIQVPSAAVSGETSIYSTILSQVLTGPLIAAALQLPQNSATNLVQNHVSAAFQGLLSQFNNPKPDFPQAVEQNNPISQLDGTLGSSDEDDDDDDDDEDDLDDDDDENDKDEDENDENEGGAEEEPLNSGDDVSDDDPTELFETDNVVVCQYDKITRSRNKWKFYLKDGIMNLNGKDYIFQRANGDAEW